MMYEKISSNLERTTLADGSLATLQKAVGGYVERVVLSETLTMWVNEEGLLQGLPINMAATILAGRQIVGDVVLESNDETQKPNK